MRTIGLLSLATTVFVALASQGALAADDLKHGKKVFKKCKACHSLEAGKNKVGPSLAGVVDRAAGAVEGFKYSQAMMDSGVTWTAENLHGYLTKPKDFMPGNKMAFAGLRKEKDRDAVIAFIKNGGE